MRISRLWTELVRDLVKQHESDCRKVNFIPGLFSWSNTILLGSILRATPNGRKAGEPINHGANPNGGLIERSVSVAVSNVALTEECKKAKLEAKNARRAAKAAAKAKTE